MTSTAACSAINHPYDFKIRRMGKRNGQRVLGWYPMAKRVANLYRYAEVSRTSNQRYLNALAVVDDPAPAYRSLRRMAEPVRYRGRQVAGFNPAAESHVALFRAVLRGDHTIRGFRNGDVRKALGLSSRNPEHRRRASAKVSRLLKRLHIHGQIAKIPRSRRWRVTKMGYAFMSFAIRLHDEQFAQGLAMAA